MGYGWLKAILGIWQVRNDWRQTVLQNIPPGGRGVHVVVETDIASDACIWAMSAHPWGPVETSGW
jgi:hypothetical protein